MRVAYVTDVEGMWSKLEGFAKDNPCVQLSSDDRLIVAPDALFVFGGDAVDRGPHSQRIIRTLLEAKRRQPAQVVLLAGNRDLNKLRLRRELSGHPPQKMPADVRAKPAPEQLRWIFSNTMGAAAAFDHRRTELGPGATDDDVVQSFIDEVSDGGPHCEYLKVCQLGFRHSATLFVHGGVTEENFLCVPGKTRASSVDSWVQSLNGWYADQLATVFTDEVDGEGRPLWTQLMAYQAPLPGTRLNQTSVVYGRSADFLNNPLLPPAAVREKLVGEGVRRLVVGHTPNGDSPSVLRAPGFEQLIADNSHARVNEGAKVLLDDETTFIDASTMLDDSGGKQRVRFELRLGDDSTPIGRRVRGSGELIKGKLEHGDLLGFRYLPDYVVVQRRVRAEELAAAELVVPE